MSDATVEELRRELHLVKNEAVRLLERAEKAEEALRQIARFVDSPDVYPVARIAQRALAGQVDE